MSGLILQTAPARELLSVAEAKDHSVIEHSNDDVLIAQQVAAARDWLETYTRRSLITRTYRLELECWLPEIELPRPPLQAVESITYWDTAGVKHTLDPSKYEVNSASMFGKVRPVHGETWPEVAPRYDAISIEFTAGYGDYSADVPAALIQAAKLGFADMYEHRETTIVGASVNVIKTMEHLAQPLRALTL